MAYQYQKESGADGSFRFDFKMDEAALYTAYASTQEETFTYDFVFTSNSTAKSIIERINSASSVSGIEDIIREERYAAGLFLPECDAEPDYPYISEWIDNGKPYQTDNIDRVIDAFKEFLAYGYVKNGDVDNMFDLEQYLRIEDIPGSEIFTADIFKESHQQEATRRMKDKEFETRQEFEDAVTEQMALALIQDPDGYANVETVCETFADRIGIDASDGSAAVWRGLYGKTLDINQTMTADCMYFTDVTPDSWFAYTVNQLTERGVISEADDKLFHPERSVSLTEAVKMLACLMGFNTYAQMNGGYPDGYMRVASEQHLLDGVGSGDVFTQGMMCELVYNALHANVMKTDYSSGDATMTVDYNETMLSYYKDIYEGRGMIEAVYGMSLTSRMPGGGIGYNRRH